MSAFALAPLTTLATSISVGDHVTGKVFGQTIDYDTVWATGVALVVILILGLMLRRQLTSGVPGRLQAAWEMGITALTKQVDDTIGPKGAAVIPLAASLFLFILVCNVFTALGLGAKYDVIAAPAGDINLPLALALYVIVRVHIASIRARGWSGYAKHYLTQPFPLVLMPFNLFINLVEEIAKPITLALRLFGNLLSGTLMLTLIAFLGVWKIGPIPVGNVLVLIVNPIWKLFDLAIGGIQAFIFALLTILYFDVAMATDHGDDETGDLIHETPEPEPTLEPALSAQVH
jgi:F-type H+-transporting ATPase subunit a